MGKRQIVFLAADRHLARLFVVAYTRRGQRLGGQKPLSYVQPRRWFQDRLVFQLQTFRPVSKTKKSAGGASTCTLYVPAMTNLSKLPSRSVCEACGKT